MWRGSRRAVSAVLGTAIALAIFFTVIIPVFLYVQSLQTLFMQEASRRLQYELERIHEKMDVHLSLALRPGEGYVIFLILDNVGTLSVNVPTVYLESTGRGLMTFTSQEILGKSFFAPGERFEKGTGQHFKNNDEVIRAKIVTLRGNGFVSENIGPKQLPHLLLVGLENMAAGVIYTVEVRRSGTEYGCVLAGMSADAPCGDSATYTMTALIPRESGLAAFMAAPGKYRIEIRVSGDTSPVIPPEEVYVFHDTVVRMRLPEPSIPSRIPLRVTSPLVRGTTITLQQSPEDISIPYAISLGSNSEPLRNVKLRATITTYQGLSCSPLQSEITIDRLMPGESYPGTFTIRVTDVSGPGGLLGYRISVVEAFGEITGKKYSDSSSIEIIEAERQIIVCRIQNNNLVCNFS